MKKNQLVCSQLLFMMTDEDAENREFTRKQFSTDMDLDKTQAKRLIEYGILLGLIDCIDTVKPKEYRFRLVTTAVLQEYEFMVTAEHNFMVAQQNKIFEEEERKEEEEENTAIVEKFSPQELAKKFLLYIEEEIDEPQIGEEVQDILTDPVDDNRTFTKLEFSQAYNLCKRAVSKIFKMGMALDLIEVLSTNAPRKYIFRLVKPESEEIEKTPISTMSVGQLAKFVENIETYCPGRVRLIMEDLVFSHRGRQDYITSKSWSGRLSVPEAVANEMIEIGLKWRVLVKCNYQLYQFAEYLDLPQT
jgi:hypothetical protein